MPALLRGTYPKAILHIDGDAFFASCEQSRDPSLRGRPVITGKERGIAASMSYEAKARGVTRAMRLSEIKKLCPDAVILPSDYETYSLLSKRFYDIVRRYTPEVEEYGIDECFAELTGWQRPLRLSYEAIAARLQEELRQELGFTFSIGLASTKSLAKIGSKWQKPYGLTAIPNKHIREYLEKLPIGSVWGIGPQTAALLNGLGICTAWSFILQEEPWIERYLSKPFKEIWQELQGRSVLPLSAAPRSEHYSVQKMKTFTPPSTDREFVFAQLCKNIESACMRARQYRLEARKASILLRTQEFHHVGLEIRLTSPTNFAHELIGLLRPAFDSLFREGVPYRATMVALSGLSTPQRQPDLFGEHLRIEGYRRLYEGIDAMRAKYGKHTLHFGSSFLAHQFAQHAGERGDTPQRQRRLLKGETKRRRLGLPMFGGTLD